MRESGASGFSRSNEGFLAIHALIEVFSVFFFQKRDYPETLFCVYFYLVNKLSARAITGLKARRPCAIYTFYSIPEVLAGRARAARIAQRGAERPFRNHRASTV